MNTISSNNSNVVSKIPCEYKVNSLCFLKDGRLVSASKRISIYKKYTLELDFSFGTCNDETSILSVCGLRNGNLAYSLNINIQIYKIDEKNYELIHILKGHIDTVEKVIELEDGRLCSCSRDKKIRIWNNTYQCILALHGHNNNVLCIIEVNDYIVSVGEQMKIWNKDTYQFIKTLNNVCCYRNNSISKLKESTIIIGENEKLFIVNVLSFECKRYEDKQLGKIESILTLREDKILLGNSSGNIIFFDSLSNQINYIQSIHVQSITCIIKSEDNKIFSSSENGFMRLFD